jgi:hypothetical protein
MIAIIAIDPQPKTNTTDALMNSPMLFGDLQFLTEVSAVALELIIGVDIDATSLDAQVILRRFI